MSSEFRPLDTSGTSGELNGFYAPFSLVPKPVIAAPKPVVVSKTSPIAPKPLVVSPKPAVVAPKSTASKPTATAQQAPVPPPKAPVIKPTGPIAIMPQPAVVPPQPAVIAPKPAVIARVMDNPPFVTPIKPIVALARFPLFQTSFWVKVGAMLAIVLGAVILTRANKTVAIVGVAAFAAHVAVVVLANKNCSPAALSSAWCKAYTILG